MNEFYLKHNKPEMLKRIDIEDFQLIKFWQYVVKRIPPIIRKLAEYYQIPASEYPVIEILFADERWEKWQLVFGKRNKLGTITGGTYFGENNRIELNPYIYLFEGGEVFISIVYHELVHWIIEKVDYLNETVCVDGKSTYHLADFSMVLNDIWDTSDDKEQWDNYRFLKQYDPAFDKWMEGEQTLRSICVHPSCFEEDGEHYSGSYLAVEDNFCTGFNVDV